MLPASACAPHHATWAAWAEWMRSGPSRRLRGSVQERGHARRRASVAAPCSPVQGQRCKCCSCALQAEGGVQSVLERHGPWRPGPSAPGGWVVDVSCITNRASDMPTGPAIQGWWMTTRVVTAQGGGGARRVCSLRCMARRVRRPCAARLLVQRPVPRLRALVANGAGRPPGKPPLTANNGGQDLAAQEVAGLAHLGLEHREDEHGCGVARGPGEAMRALRRQIQSHGLSQVCHPTCCLADRQSSRPVLAKLPLTNAVRGGPWEPPGRGGQRALTRCAEAAHNKSDVDLGRGPLVERAHS